MMGDQSMIVALGASPANAHLLWSEYEVNNSRSIFIEQGFGFV
jgi:hypothetical protein